MANSAKNAAKASFPARAWGPGTRRRGHCGGAVGDALESSKGISKIVGITMKHATIFKWHWNRTKWSTIIKLWRFFFLIFGLTRTKRPVNFRDKWVCRMDDVRGSGALYEWWATQAAPEKIIMRQSSMAKMSARQTMPFQILIIMFCLQPATFLKHYPMKITEIQPWPRLDKPPSDIITWQRWVKSFAIGAHSLRTKPSPPNPLYMPLFGLE